MVFIGLRSQHGASYADEPVDMHVRHDLARPQRTILAYSKPTSPEHDCQKEAAAREQRPSRFPPTIARPSHVPLRLTGFVDHGAPGPIVFDWSGLQLPLRSLQQQRAVGSDPPARSTGYQP